MICISNHYLTSSFDDYDKFIYPLSNIILVGGLEHFFLQHMGCHPSH